MPIRSSGFELRVVVVGVARAPAVSLLIAVATVSTSSLIGPRRGLLHRVELRNDGPGRAPSPPRVASSDRGASRRAPRFDALHEIAEVGRARGGRGGRRRGLRRRPAQRSVPTASSADDCDRDDVAARANGAASGRRYRTDQGAMSRTKRIAGRGARDATPRPGIPTGWGQLPVGRSRPRGRGARPRVRCGSGCR